MSVINESDSAFDSDDSFSEACIGCGRIGAKPHSFFGKASCSAYLKRKINLLAAMTAPSHLDVSLLGRCRELLAALPSDARAARISAPAAGSYASDRPLAPSALETLHSLTSAIHQASPSASPFTARSAPTVSQSAAARTPFGAQASAWLHHVSLQSVAGNPEVFVLRCPSVWCHFSTFVGSRERVEHDWEAHLASACVSATCQLAREREVPVESLCMGSSASLSLSPSIDAGPPSFGPPAFTASSFAPAPALPSAALGPASSAVFATAEQDALDRATAFQLPLAGAPPAAPSRRGSAAAKPRPTAPLSTLPAHPAASAAAHSEQLLWNQFEQPQHTSGPLGSAPPLSALAFGPPVFKSAPSSLPAGAPVASPQELARQSAALLMVDLSLLAVGGLASDAISAPVWSSVLAAHPAVVAEVMEVFAIGSWRALQAAPARDRGQVMRMVSRWAAFAAPSPADVGVSVSPPPSSSAIAPGALKDVLTDVRTLAGDRIPIMFSKKSARGPLGPASSSVHFTYALHNVPSPDHVVAAFLARVPDIRIFAESSAVLSWLQIVHWQSPHLGASALFLTLPLATIPSLAAFLPSCPADLTDSDFLLAIDQVHSVFTQLFGAQCDVVVSLAECARTGVFTSWREEAAAAVSGAGLAPATVQARILIDQTMAARFLRSYASWHLAATRVLLPSFRDAGATLRPAGTTNEATSAVSVDFDASVDLLWNVMSRSSQSLADVACLRSALAVAAPLPAHKLRSEGPAAVKVALPKAAKSNPSDADTHIMVNKAAAPAWLAAAVSAEASTLPDTAWKHAHPLVYSLRLKDTLARVCFSYLRTGTCSASNSGRSCAFAHVSLSAPAPGSAARTFSVA